MAHFKALVLLLYAQILIGYSACDKPPRILRQFCSRDIFSNRRSCRELKTVSNSTFKFGIYDDNVLNVSEAQQNPDAILILWCEASYPIYWLAAHPHGSIIPTSAGKVDDNQADLGLGHYAIQLEIKLRWKFSNFLQCRSFLDKQAADLILVSNRNYRTPFQNQYWYSFYLPTSYPGQGNSKELVVPCFGGEYGSSAVLVLTTVGNGKKDQVRNPITSDCAYCICNSYGSDAALEPTSACGNITNYQWPSLRSDQIKLLMQSNVNSKEACLEDPSCAQSVVQSYFTNTTKSVEFDCNQDRVLTCEDYARFHLLSNRGSCKRLLETETESKYLDNLQACINKTTGSVIIYTASPNNYDFRQGFKIQGLDSISGSSVFKCAMAANNLNSNYWLLPLPRDAAVDATLELDDTADPKLIHCKSSVLTTDIVWGKCNSIVNCTFRWSSWPHLDIHGDRQPFISKGPREYKMSSDMIEANFNHGFLLCSALRRKTNSANRDKYISIVDYFFTGLDGRQYLHNSQEFVNAAIIKIKNDTVVEQGNGAAVLFECTISTFVLFPRVQWLLRFMDGRMEIVNANGISNTTEIILKELRKNEEKAIQSWRITISQSTQIKQISCQALFMAVNHLAKSEEIDINPDFFNEKMRKVGETLNLDKHEVGNPYWLILIIGCLSGVIFIAAVVTGVVCYVKQRSSMAVITTMGINGEIASDEMSSDKWITFDGISFDPIIQIPQSSVRIDPELLGQGEFGVVRKGCFENEIVAVKTIKSNSDPNYFVEFLKEINVMASVGRQGHPNVIGFIGAILDDLHNRNCSIVVEFSPRGNLNSVLRRWRSDLRAVKYTVIDQECREEYVRWTDYGNTKENQAAPKTMMNFCRQVANGMEFLSNKNIIHADLATRNILVFNGHNLKIADFGLSKNLYESCIYISKNRHRLPWRWMAIESLKNLEFSTASDIWAFGVLTWEIFSYAEVPYSIEDWSPEFVKRLEQGFRLPMPDNATEEIYAAMKRCWNCNPDERPSFSDCKDFFANLLESSLLSQGNVNNILCEPAEMSGKFISSTYV